MSEQSGNAASEFVTERPKQGGALSGSDLAFRHSALIADLMVSSMK
ncbi:hypothetical protein [Falsiroseomonas sp. HW251]